MLFGILVFGLSLFLMQKFYERFPFINQNILLSSYVFHTVMGSYYWYYTLINRGDAYAYYMEEWGEYTLAPGTYFILTLVEMISDNFPTNYYSMSMLFNFFGMFGLWFFYVSIREQLWAQDKYSLWVLNAALFIPGVNFWTSAVGKDSLIFLGLGLFFYATSQIEIRKRWLVVAGILIFWIRPHVAAVVCIAFALTLLLGRVNMFTRILLGGGGGAVLLYLLPAAIEFAGLESVSVESIESYTAVRQEANLGGGSSLDISQYNFFQQVFAYLFRPLFFDAHNLHAVVASFENLGYLYIIFQLASPHFYQFVIVQGSFYVKFSIIYSMAMLLMLAPTTSNLGIAVRQKNMFIFCLIGLFCIYSSYLYRRRELVRNSLAYG